MVVNEDDISGDIIKDDHSPSLDHYSPLIESLVVHHPKNWNCESLIHDDWYIIWVHLHVLLQPRPLGFALHMFLLLAHKTFEGGCICCIERFGLESQIGLSACACAAIKPTPNARVRYSTSLVKSRESLCAIILITENSWMMIISCQNA